MNAIFRSKSSRMLSALLAVLMIVAMLPTTAFAWSAEEGTKCTSTYGDKYLGSDGDYFYSKPTTTAIFYNDNGSYYVKSYASGNAKYKYMMIDGSGNYHHVYCIEGGVSFDYSDTYNSTSGKNSKYFQNLPITAQYGIMMALMYGYHEGMTTPVAGTNNDDFAFATQCIIWEYQQQLRTSPTSIASNNGISADMYNHTIKGRPAEKCYNWILEQMSKHYVVPSFSSRSQSSAQTYTLKYDQAKDNYSLTLTDTNNTLADINFTASGITVTRSGNQYELQNLLDRFYEQTVPERERMEVEAQIELEREREAAAREASRRFAVVHFHEGDDDFFFTSELRNNFYSIANLYRSTLKDEVGKYTLDSIEQNNFSGCQTINVMTFSVLCDAMPNDPRITALVEFDFDHNTVSVCESSDNAWWTYNLKDVSAAMYKAERKEGLPLDARHEIFATALEGKEITFDEGEDESPDLQM